MIRDYLNWMATPKNDGIWTNRWILRSTLALYQNTDEIHLSKYEMNLYEVSINIQTMRNKQWVELISWSISEVNMTFLYVPLPTKFLNSLSSPKNVSSERFYTFTLICLWGRTLLTDAAMTCVWRSEDNPQESVLSFPPCGSLELNSGHRAWRQAPFPAEPSQQLGFCIFENSFRNHEL